VITVEAGKHQVKVKKDGFEAYGQEVDLQAGSSDRLIVRLIRLADSRPTRDPSDDRTSPADAPKAQAAPVDSGFATTTSTSPPLSKKESGTERDSTVPPMRIEPKAIGSTAPSRQITNSIGMKLVLIPAGEFLMGSPDGDGDGDEHPQHRVRITRPFYLGATEVTRGQFRRFVDEAGYRTAAEKDGKGGNVWNEAAGKFELDPKCTWQNPGFEQTDEHPVVIVSWNDAVAFCVWLSGKEGVRYRLPTEAEWEYACRAGTTTRYSSGDDPEGLAAVGNIADATLKAKYANLKRTTIAARDGYIDTAPVGRYNPNRWGLFDMHGNVWEWCSDGYAADYYNRSPLDDPPGVEGAPLRVFRGGGWDMGPCNARSADRWHTPGMRTSSVGFRLAREPEKVPGTVDLAREAIHSFRPLFNGKDLTGWKDLSVNKSGWKVEAGLLIGRTDTNNGLQCLVTDRADYSDFRLKVRVKNTDDNHKLRSIAIRSSFSETSYNGYLIVVGGNGFSRGTTLPVGTICKADNRPHNWVISWNVLAEPAPIAVGEWYDFEVTAIGKQITTSVNGRKVAEYVDGAGPFTSGAITLTYWRTSIQYKDIMIEEFPRDRKAESPGTVGDQ
jgi:formylglycine-generating enzyme required for sulfatase activity